MIKKQNTKPILGLLLILSVAGFAVYDLTHESTPQTEKTASLNQASEPVVSTAIDPMGIDAPVRGPLTTDELKHIELTDQDGKNFSLDDLKGDTLLVNFMFAACTTICPVQTVGLRDIHKNIQLDSANNRIKLLSISIAPLSDTPKQLKAYAERFEIDSPNWRFAMTSQAHTDELSEQFGVGVKPLEGDQLDHRSLLYLINHEGVMIQQYRGGVVNVERVTKELQAVDQIGRS